MNTVISIPNAFYHRLSQNTKETLQTGPLDVCLGSDNRVPILSFQIGHTFITITQQDIILMVEYPSLSTYYIVHESQNVVTAITIDKANLNRLNLEEYLRQTAKVVQIPELQSQERLKGVIEENWPWYQTKAPINGDVFQKFISTAGHTLGQGIVTAGAKISDYWNKDKGLFQVREEPSWFDNLKGKAGSILRKTGEVVGSVMSPVFTKSREVKSIINNKIDQGDSTTMKYIKDITELSTEAAKNVFYGTKAAITGKQVDYTGQNLSADQRHSGQRTVQEFDPRNINFVEAQQSQDPLLLKRDN